MAYVSFTDPLSGNTITPDQAKAAFMKAMSNQMKKIKVTGGNTTVAPEFKKGYEEKKKYIEEFLVERMATKVATDSLNQIMEGLYFQVTEGMQGAGNITSGIGNQIGYFFEQGMFGEAKGSDPSSDLREVMVELKHSKADSNARLNVGDITLNSTESIISDPLKNQYGDILAAYKMYAKMQNLLLLRTSWESSITTVMSGELKGKKQRRVSIDELMLYMELIFEKLWKVIKNEAQGRLANSVILKEKREEDVYVKTADGFNAPGKKIKYSIYLDMRKVEGAYTWSELYLRKKDMLSIIRTDQNIRADFFGRVRHMQEFREIKNKILPTF